MPPPDESKPTSRIRSFRLAAVLGFAAVCGYAVWLVNLAGEFKSLPESDVSARCKPLPIPGAEDAALSVNGDRVYIVSVDRRKHPSVDGAVFVLDIPAAATEDGATEGGVTWAPRRATGKLDFPFHPHGLGADQHQGRDRVWVINHRSGDVLSAEDDAVEVFEAGGGGQLTHTRTIAHPLVVAPNDLAPVDDGFYASIDHRYPRGLMRKVEDYGRGAWSFVLWWHGGQARPVIEGLRYANGVALSSDRRKLYVAATTDREVSIFDRKGRGDAAQLTRLATHELATGVDNITVGMDGALWVSAHPKLLTFLRHATDPDVISPTEVLHMPSGESSWQRRLLDTKGTIPGGAVAVPLGNGGTTWPLLVGPVYANAAICGE